MTALPDTADSARWLVAGRYRVRSVLDRSGKDLVWLAEDRLLRRSVALKRFPVNGTGTAERTAAHRRALREAQAAALVDHRGAVRIYDVVKEDGGSWIVMERLAGRTLREVLVTDGPLSIAAGRTVGMRILEALRAVHRAGLVHCDVKPGNVHLCDSGRVVLADFGIASAAGEPAHSPTGEFTGSPAYVAPERIQGGEIAPASDLFSLGATLFAAVEGRSPFLKDSPSDTLLAVLLDPPPPLLRAGPLRPVIEGLLAKDPERRLTLDQAYAVLRAVRTAADSPRWTKVETRPCERSGQGGERTALDQPPRPAAALPGGG